MWQPQNKAELDATDFEHTNGICNICGGAPEVHTNTDGHISCPPIIGSWAHGGGGVDTTNIDLKPAGCTCSFEKQGYHSWGCDVYPKWYDEELESLNRWWAAYPGEVPCKCDPIEVGTRNAAASEDQGWESPEPCGHKHCPFEACPLGTCVPECLQVAYAFNEDVTSKGHSSYCHCPCHG
jgi:hypothetical protein